MACCKPNPLPLSAPSFGITATLWDARPALKTPWVLPAARHTTALRDALRRKQIGLARLQPTVIMPPEVQMPACSTAKPAPQEKRPTTNTTTADSSSKSGETYHIRN